MNKKTGLVLAGLAAAGILASGVGGAVADTYRTRVAGEWLPVEWSDTGVTGGGSLRARLTLTSNSGNLNILTASSGFYNSQLQFMCSNVGVLDAINRNNVFGTVLGDASRTCAWWEGSMSGILGWIDDI